MARTDFGLRDRGTYWFRSREVDRVHHKKYGDRGTYWFRFREVDRVHYKKYGELVPTKSIEDILRLREQFEGKPKREYARRLREWRNSKPKREP